MLRSGNDFHTHHTTVKLTYKGLIQDFQDLFKIFKEVRCREGPLFRKFLKENIFSENLDLDEVRNR